MIRTTVFGLDVWADAPLAVLDGAQAPPTGRSLDLLIDQGPTRLADWPAQAQLLGEQPSERGGAFTIQADQDAGWLLSGERYGEHLLSADGLRLRCVPGAVAEQDWQRFLVAQVLPFAAAVKGLEVMHASAVVLRGRAVALLGAGGAGKTTLALELCSLGAGFLADDVLALEVVDGQLLAHPGTPLAAVGHGAAERLCAMPAGRGPALLSDLLVIERWQSGPSHAVFEPLRDPRRLLAGTFNQVLRDGEHAARLLDVCALAARRRPLRLRAGLNVEASRLATAVSERLKIAA